MDKLRQLYNRLVANGMTKTPTFEEWVANRKEEDYEIISGDYPEINTFRDKNDYLTTLRLYKKPEEIETPSAKPIELPKTEVKVEKPVETPEYPFGKVEFGKQPPIKNGGVRTTSEEKKQLIQNKTAPIGEAPSNLTKLTTTEQVKPILPEGVSVGMEKMNIEARGLEALQKAETIQRNEIIKEVGLYPENFQEGTPYDIGRKLYKINGLPENEQQQKIAELGITPFPEDVEELGKRHILGYAAYRAFQDGDKEAMQKLIVHNGEQTVNKALNDFSNKAINKSLTRSINQYLDYEGKIKERADDKILIQNSLKKLEEEPKSVLGHVKDALFYKEDGLTDEVETADYGQKAILREKLKTNPKLTPQERQVLETLTGEVSHSMFGHILPDTELQKIQYLNDPNPDKKITPDIELDLKLNNPNYKLAVWDETDTKRFLDVNPDLSPTPENKKEYWKERDRSNPYAKAWLDNPMIMSDKYEELFQTQEVQAAGEAMGKKYGALLSQYGESPKEKMEAYWNLAMSRYLELMPIVEEQTKNFDKGWGNAYVRTQQGGGSPYAETAGEISGDLILSLTNQIASLFTPGEKGVFTNEQIEFIALTNKLRALTPMVVSGKLPTESKALDNSWLTDFTNRFASGVEQIGTPGSVSAKTRGLLTNDAIASLYEAGVMENLTQAKSKEIELATSEEGGLWSRKWMINPETPANFGGNLVGIAAPIMIIPSPLGKMEAIEGIGIARGSKIAKVLFNESGKLNFIGKVANTAQKSAQMGLDYEARGQVMGLMGKKQYQEELNFGTGFVGGVGRFVLDDALGIAGKALKKKLNVTSEAIEKGAGRIFGNSSKEITEETLQEMYQSWVRADGDFATWQKDMFGKDGVFGSWNKSLGFLVGIGAAGWMDGYSTEDTKNLMLKAAKANNIPNAEEVVQEFVEGLQESEKNGIANIGQDGEKLIFQDKNGAQYTTEKGLDGQITVTPIGVVENPDIEGVRLVAEELYSQGKETPEVVAPEPVAPSEQNRRRGEKQIKAAFNKLNEAKTPEEQLDAINLLERNEREGAKLTKDEKQQIQKAKDNLSANGYEMPELLGKQFHQGLKVIVTSSIPDENLAEGEEVISKVITPTINKSYTQEEIDNLEVKINEATGEISYYDKNHDITYYSKPKVGEEKMVRTGQIEVTVGTKKGGLTREQWLKERNNTQTPVTQEQAAPETKEKITPEVVAPIEEAAPEIVSEETPKNEGKETTVQPEGEKKAIERKKPIPKTKTAVTEKEGRLVNSKGEVLESDEEMYDEIASKSYDADEIAKAIEERKVATVEQTDENIIEEFLPLLDMKSKDVSENVTDPIARGKAGKQTLDGLIESINEQHPGRFDDDLRNKILDQLSQKPDKKAKDPTLAKLEKRYFDITGKKYVKPKPAQEVSFKQKEELDELKKKRAEKVAKGFTTVKIDNRIAELEEGMKAEALKAEATEIEKAEEEAWNKEAAEMARIEAAIEREEAEIAANPNRSQEKIKRLRKLKQKAVERAKPKTKEVAPETTEQKPEVKQETKKEESVFERPPLGEKPKYEWRKATGGYSVDKYENGSWVFVAKFPTKKKAIAYIESKTNTKSPKKQGELTFEETVKEETKEVAPDTTEQKPENKETKPQYRVHVGENIDSESVDDDGYVYFETEEAANDFTKKVLDKTGDFLSVEKLSDSDTEFSNRVNSDKAFNDEFTLQEKLKTKIDKKKKEIAAKRKRGDFETDSEEAAIEELKAKYKESEDRQTKRMAEILEEMNPNKPEAKEVTTETTEPQQETPKSQNQQIAPKSKRATIPFIEATKRVLNKLFGNALDISYDVMAHYEAYKAAGASEATLDNFLASSAFVSDYRLVDGKLVRKEEAPDAKTMIVFNLEKIKENTAGHELFHVWFEGIKASAKGKEIIDRAVKLITTKGEDGKYINPKMQQIENTAGYAGHDEEYKAEEALAELIGDAMKALLLGNFTAWEAFQHSLDKSVIQRDIIGAVKDILKYLKIKLAPFFKFLADKKGDSFNSFDFTLGDFAEYSAKDIMAGNNVSSNKSDIHFQLPETRLEYNLDGSLKTPFGKPSELEENQWRVVRTPAFKKWFGDWEKAAREYRDRKYPTFEKALKANGVSMVVNQKTGEPLVVYHGTQTDITVFRESESIGSHGEDDQLEGIYFTDNREVANWYALSDDSRFTKSVFLSIKNPYASLKHSTLKNELSVKKMNGVKSLLIKKKHDGIFLDEGFYTLGLQKLYLSFSPTQIKLADGSNTTFSPTNPDIRFQLDDIYHGSPRNIDRFSTDYLERYSDYGWGIYLTDDKGVARQYSEGLPQYSVDESKHSKDAVNKGLEELDFADGDKNEAISNIKDSIQNYKSSIYGTDKQKADKIAELEEAIKVIQEAEIINPKYLYTTTLFKGRSHTLLDDNKPVDDKILDKISKAGYTFEKGITGGQLYYALTKKLNSDKKAVSLFLLKSGIDGIRFPAEDNNGHRLNNGKFNYVVFDENAITIEDKIKFQIIGENSNMDAQTRKNLNIAKQMDSDGLDPEKIWLATGWEMGVDGKWRYEIPDNKPKNGLVGILKGNPKGLTLSDILTSKPLYEAYPQLKDIKVKIKPMERGENAHYNSQTNEIVFNEIIIADKGVDPNEAIHSTLIHEVQHAIQRIEGFARGGNETEFVATQNLFAEMKERLELIIQVDELANKNKVSPREFVDKAGYTKKEREYLYSVTERFDDWKYIVSIAKDKLLTPRQKYRRLAGEVEARNVETRAKMPMSERRVKPISRTEDVSRDNQIVMFDNPKFQLPEAEIINGFYSPLEDALNRTKSDKLPVKQWIDKFANTEEAKWTGLRAWLEQQEGSITKSEIQKFLKENRIEIKEVVKGQAERRVFEKVKVKPFVFNVVDEKGNIVKENLSEQKADDFIDSAYNGDTTKFSEYQLEGEKENYKEVLVILQFKPTEIANEINEWFAKKKEKYGEGFVNKLNPEEKLERETLFDKLQSSPKTPSFKSSHFDEPNILVHLRMNIRTDGDGNKVLFLEEVQSDWGQNGKKEGFVPEKLITNKNFIDYRTELYGKYDVDKLNDLRKVAKQDELATLETLFANENETKNPLVPQAPFVTDTNAWVKLALKVALKEAVKQGVDKIAWTTGEQQNDRYDLSKKVDKIDVEAVEDVEGLFFVDIKLSNGDIENLEVENGIIREGNYSGQRLDNVIGKDYADKVLSTPRGENKTLKGDDLKVGGKGMKGFYGSPTEGSLGIVGGVAKSLFKQEPKTITINGMKEHAVTITPELKAQTAAGLPKFQLPERSRTALNEMEFEGGYDWVEDYETTDDEGREEIRQNLIEYLEGLGDPEAESHVDDYLAEKFPTPLPVPLPENKEGGTGKQAVRKFSDNLRKFADNLSGKFRDFVLGYKPVYNRIADDVQLAKAITILEQAISDKVRSKAEAHVKYKNLSKDEEEIQMTEYLEQMDTNPQFREDVISEAFDDFVEKNLKEEGADLPDEPARIVAAMIILRNVTEREEALRKSGKIKEADALLDKARLLADKIAYVGTMAGRMVRVFAMWSTLSTGGAMSLIKANLKAIHDAHFDKDGNPTDLYGQSVKFVESLEKGLKEALKTQWVDLSGKIGDLRTELSSLNVENDKMKKVIDRIQRHWDDTKNKLEEERKDRAKLVQEQVRKAMQNTGTTQGKSVTQKTTQNTNKTGIVSTLRSIFMSGVKAQIEETIMDAIKTPAGLQAITDAIKDELNKGRSFAQARANIIADFISEGVMKMDDIGSADFEIIMDAFEVAKVSLKVDGTVALAKAMLGDAITDPVTGGDILIRGLQARMSDELQNILPQDVTEEQAKEVALNAINDEVFINTLLEELKTLKDPVKGLKELNQLRTDNGFAPIGGQKKSDFLQSVRGKTKAQIAAEIRKKIAEAMKTDRPLNEQLMDDMGIDKATADMLTALVNEELRAQAMTDAYKVLDSIIDSIETMEKKGKKALLDTAMKAFHVKTKDGLREKLFQLIAVSSGNKDLTEEVVNRLKGALGIDYFSDADIEALEKLKEAADKAPQGRMKEWANKQFLNEAVKRMAGGTGKYNLRLFLYRGGYWALFYPAMLSGFSTHLINTESNLFILLSDFINGLIRWAMGDKSEGAGLWAMLNPRTTAKAIQSAWDAFWMGEGRTDTASGSMQKDLVNAMRPTTDPMKVSFGNFFLMAVYGFMPGFGVGRALRKGDYQLVSMATRLLGALDRFIMVYHVERNRAVLASRVGDTYEGISNKVIDNTLLDGQTIGSILASEESLYDQYGGTPAIWKRIRRDELYSEALNRRAGYADVADDYARVRALRSPVTGTLGILARAINSVIADKPILRLLVPFVNTTFNYMNLSLSKTPLLFAHMAGYSLSRAYAGVSSIKYDLGNLTKKQQAIADSINEEAMALTGKPFPTNKLKEEVRLRELGAGRENDPSLAFRFRYKAEQARVIWKNLEAQPSTPEIDEQIKKYQQIEKAYIAAADLERGREKVSAMFVGASMVMFALYVMAAAAILGDEPEKEILPGLTAKEIIGMIKITGTKVGERFSGQMREQATEPVMSIWLFGKPYSFRQTIWNIELAQLGSIQDQLEAEMKKPKKDRKGFGKLTATAMLESTAGLLYSASGLQGGIGVLQLIADIGEGKPERVRDRMIKFGTPMLLIPNISKQTARLATGGNVYYAGDDIGDIATNVFYKATNVAFIDPMQPRISEIDGKRVISLPGEMGGEIFFQSVVKPQLEWRMSNPTHLWLSSNNLYSAIPERRYSGANVDIIVENEEGEEYFDKAQMTPAQFNKYIETTATAAFKDLTGMVKTNKFVLNKAITRKQWASIPELKGKTKKLEGNKYSITATPAEFEQLALKGLWDTPSAEWSKKLKGERNVQWWAMEKVVRTLYKDKNSEYLKKIKPIMRK